MIFTSTYHIYPKQSGCQLVVQTEHGVVIETDCLDNALRHAEVFVDNHSDNVDWEDFSDTHTHEAEDGSAVHCVISRKGTLRDTHLCTQLFLKWTNIYG